MIQDDIIDISITWDIRIPREDVIVQLGHLIKLDEDGKLDDFSDY